jgi:hypothetical protein
MAKGDVKIVDTGGRDTIPTKTFKVQDQTTSSGSTIYPGDPVKISGAEGGNYVIQLADGDPEIGTDIVVGIAASESTETSSADGEVEVYLALPGMVYRCDANTGSNLASGILYDTVTFDLSGTTFTVDEDEGSDEDVHGLRIVDYDEDNDTVDFIIKDNATMFGCSIA